MIAADIIINRFIFISFLGSVEQADYSVSSGLCSIEVRMSESVEIVKISQVQGKTGKTTLKARALETTKLKAFAY